MTLMHFRALTLQARTIPRIHQIGGRLLSSLCEEDGNFTGPSVKTEVPGPLSKRELQELSQFQDTTHLMFIVDYEKSKGNYVKDIDGNVYLDVNQQSSLLPLGYNHTAVLKAVQSKEHLTHLMNTPPLTSVLTGFQGKKIKELLLKVAPSGLNAVYASECGVCSLQSATQAALLSFVAQWKDDFKSDLVALIRQECSGEQSGGEKKCFEVLAKEHPDLRIISFVHPGHKALSAEGEATTNGQDLLVPFPDCHYSRSQSTLHNMSEEGRCLEKVFGLFKDYLSIGKHIGAVRIEPVQNTGSRYASPEFYRSVQAIAREFNAVFIVDEQFTGLGATGSFWAHEDWKLPYAPDMVVLPRKMHVGGFYFNPEVMPNPFGEIMNSWLGDASRLLILQAVLKVMDRKKLLSRTKSSGDALLNGLTNLKEKYPMFIKDVQGKGTFCSIALDDKNLRSDFGNRLRKLGLQHSMEQSYLCLRPPLIFTPDHAVLTCNLLEDAFEQNNRSNC